MGHSQYDDASRWRAAWNPDIGETREELELCRYRT